MGQNTSTSSCSNRNTINSSNKQQQQQQLGANAGTGAIYRLLANDSSHFVYACLARLHAAHIAPSRSFQSPAQCGCVALATPTLRAQRLRTAIRRRSATSHAHQTARQRHRHTHRHTQNQTVLCARLLPVREERRPAGSLFKTIFNSGRSFLHASKMFKFEFVRQKAAKTNEKC